MNSVDLFFTDDEEEETEIHDADMLIVFRKILRNSSNPFDLSDSRFARCFGLSKEAFKYVLDEIQHGLHAAVRSSSVPPVLKLATTLSILKAEGGYQHGAGNDCNLGLAQPTISKVVKEVIDVLEKLIFPIWVKYEMTEEEKAEVKLHFYEKFGLPGVIGCVDGTHIKILTPKKEVQHMYLNRKGFYSLNALIVCDHKMRIRYLDTRNPGACDDALIWNKCHLRSILRTRFESGEANTWLLGDAEYPLEPYLITPFRTSVEGSSESSFNATHARGRNVIARTIGVLKNRFRCLLGTRQLHYSPEKASKITNVCAALHNICISYKVSAIADGEIYAQGEALPIKKVEEKTDNTVAAAIRNEIMIAMNI